jgi:hypothetical protein
MKKSFVILFSTYLLTSCAYNKPENIIAHIYIINRIDTIRPELGYEKFYSAKIDLKNYRSSILKYWTMSCSWQSNWISDNKFISFFVMCPRNIPEIVEIEPFGSLSHSGIIIQSDTTNFGKNNESRLGFVLVRKNEVKDVSDFISILRNKIKTKKDIYWSNSFKINE